MGREQIIVQSKDAGKRLDRFLAEHLTDCSRAQVQRLITEGAVLYNGIHPVKRQSVAAGDSIEIDTRIAQVSGGKGAVPLPQEIPIEILYEDDFLIAVYKPSGLVVHPGNGVPDGTLVNALLYREQSLSDGFSAERPGIVHRLDKETSGVVLAAKKNRIHTRLAAAFAGRKVSKWYMGLCIGKPGTVDGTIDLPLDRSRREPVKRAVSTAGKEARTSYELVVYRSGISLMNFFPHTGRTHQIRVHSSSKGFPILADTLYGGGKDRITRIEPCERPFAYGIYKCFTRHALHAYQITFDHPETSEQMCIRAPLPADFRNALRMFDDPELLQRFSGIV
ncbi:MAG: RluA family pseudouridine synthase [Chitinispirillaceae bacterium]|nr:RluA family pseudouridine synthase [Chitinispirillaceae bacterium]